MKKIKKLVAISLVLVMSAFLIPDVSAGAKAVKLPDRIVSPMYVDIDTFMNSFDIHSGGRASVCTSMFSGTADAVYVICYLEKQRPDGYFNTVTSWSSYRSGPIAYCGGDYYVAHGTYRIHSYGYVYIDGVITDYDSYTSYLVTY